MSADATKLIETYALRPRPLTAEDLPLLHELSVSVHWSHRAEDLRLLMEMGEGLIACDPIGRIVGSAMWFPMGDVAMLGMVITSPKLQARGAGQWLMTQAMAACGARSYRLNATRAAYRLYAGMGFRPLGQVVQRQGVVGAVAQQAVPGGAELRAARPQDLEAILALDLVATGLSRGALLARALELGPALVLVRDGLVTGAAFRRRAGRGTVVGPVIARSEAAALALTGAHLVQLTGDFVRIDCPCGPGAFATYLEACGLARHDSVTPMCLGPGAAPPEAGPGQAATWALVNQSLG